MLDGFVVGLSSAVLLVLLGAREIVYNPPTSRLSSVTSPYILTSPILNNEGSKAFGGTVRRNEFLDYERYV